MHHELTFCHNTLCDIIYELFLPLLCSYLQTFPELHISHKTFVSMAQLLMHSFFYLFTFLRFSRERIFYSDSRPNFIEIVNRSGSTHSSRQTKSASNQDKSLNFLKLQIALESLFCASDKICSKSKQKLKFLKLTNCSGSSKFAREAKSAPNQDKSLNCFKLQIALVAHFYASDKICSKSKQKLKFLKITNRLGSSSSARQVKSAAAQNNNPSAVICDKSKQVLLIESSTLPVYFTIYIDSTNRF